MQTSRNQDLYVFQGFQVDVVRRQLRQNGKLVPLTSKAFETLLYLIERTGETVSKTDLMNAVWNDVAVEENNLTQQISTLRKAFNERPDDHRFIVTIPRQGYCFVAPLEISPKVVYTQKARFDPSVMRGYSLAAAQIALIVFAFLWSAFFVQNDGRSHSLAVLNFKVSASGDEFIGSGISDTLRARLGSVDDLIVRPSLEDPADVDLIVRGSIQRDHDRMRVVVEMLEVGQRRIVWGKTFDTSNQGVFELQDQIASEVVKAIDSNLSLGRS